MTAAPHILAAIMDGKHDDATISAALDVLREEGSFSLIGAVTEVARLHKAHHDAAQMAQAAAMLRSGSPLRRDLSALIVAECPGADEDAAATVLLEEGSGWPHLAGLRLDLPFRSPRRQHISVGAEWVVARGEVMRTNRAKERAARLAEKSK